MSSQQYSPPSNHPIYLVYYLQYGTLQWGLYSRYSPVGHISTTIDHAFTFCTTKLAKKPISDKDAFFSELANKWIIWRDDGSAYCAIEERKVSDQEHATEPNTARNHLEYSTGDKESGEKDDTGGPALPLESMDAPETKVGKPETGDKHDGKESGAGEQKTALEDLRALATKISNPHTGDKEGSPKTETVEPEPALGNLHLLEMEIEKPQGTSLEEVDELMEGY
ncbi:MAG: hypothetical protein Q9221_003545 [Calogaya cf. arnoldii]